MRKIPVWIQKYEQIIFAVGFNAIWLFIELYFGSSFFATSDDCAMNDIASGYYGDKWSAYTVFNNIIYGYILKFLYGITSGINCYALLEILSVFISFVMVSYALYCYYGRTVSFIVSLINICFFSYYGYLSVQFTYQAAFLCVTGFVIFYIGICAKRNSFLLIGAILGFWGFLVRKDVFLSILPFAFIWLLSFCLVRENRNNILKKIRDNKWRNIVIWGWVILILASYIVNARTYNKGGWDYYLEYNNYRALLLDSVIPEYNANVDIYNDIDFSENDYLVFLNWIYADENKYSIENLKKIEEKTKDDRKLRIDNSILKGVFLGLRETLENYSTAILVIILSTFAIVYLDISGKLSVLAVWGGIIGEYWYLVCKGRLLFRCYFGIWYIAFFVILLLILQERKKLKEKSIVYVSPRMLIVICSAIVVLNHSLFFNIYDSWNCKRAGIVEIDESVQNLIDELSWDSDNLYLGTTLGFNSSRKVKVFELNSVHKANFLSLGGWLCPSPIYKDVLGKYNVENPLQALSEARENLFLVCKDGEQVISNISVYLQENYNPSIDLELVDSKYGFSFYKVYYK